MISSINNNHQIIPNTKRQLAFGQITPKHIFINMDTYPKDPEWAIKSCKLIDRLKEDLINKKPLFNSFIYTARNKYKKAYHNSVQNAGAKRLEDGGFTFNAKKYKEYYLEKSKKYWHNLKGEPKGKRKAKSIPATINGKQKTIGELQLFESRLDKDNVTEFSVIKNTDPKDLKAFMNETQKIYKETNNIIADIRQGNKTNKNLQSLNKNVGKFHWYFTNMRPYIRGTAGIADIISKSFYEAAEVQVSPFKKNVAPDLEAMVTPLDEYMENYHKLFEKPPEFMK